MTKLMLNKLKNILIKRQNHKKIAQLKFDSYLDYQKYFLDEDKATNWDSSYFSKIINEKMPNVKNLVLLEIGVARGETSRYTITKLSDRLDVYYGVDPYVSNYDKKDSFSHYSQTLMDHCYLYALNKNQDIRFKLLRTSSYLAAKTFSENSIDAIFVDGDHTYEGTKQDLTIWENKVKPGGLIIGDDFQTFEGVRRAVSENFRSFEQDGNYWHVIR